jgi:hypothetical protein
LLFAVVALLLLAGAAGARAQDLNTAPPQVELRSAGNEAILGPAVRRLATFRTAAPDPSWEYAPQSAVSFTCTIDGRAIPCGSTYFGCCKTPSATPLARQFGLGTFIGSVPVPRGLASGPHTVTVTATDEDGTGPPASVPVTYDTTPPSAPELIEAPPRASHDHKPTFRYTATDDVRLIGKRDEAFRAALRRLGPRPEVIFREHRESFYIGTWSPRCSTLRTCTGRSRASYEGFQRNLGFGVPEWLPAGRYEFSVYARDAVGNESPPTHYRFRILRGRGSATG